MLINVFIAVSRILLTAHIDLLNNLVRHKLTLLWRAHNVFDPDRRCNQLLAVGSVCSCLWCKTDCRCRVHPIKRPSQQMANNTGMSLKVWRSFPYRRFFVLHTCMTCFTLSALPFAVCLTENAMEAYGRDRAVLCNDVQSTCHNYARKNKSSCPSFP